METSSITAKQLMWTVGPLYFGSKMKLVLFFDLYHEVLCLHMSFWSSKKDILKGKEDYQFFQEFEKHEKQSLNFDKPKKCFLMAFDVPFSMIKSYESDTQSVREKQTGSSLNA